MYTDSFLPKITHPFGCSSNHAGHVHLLGVWHHCRIDGFSRGVCSHEEASDQWRASVSHVAVIKLKLWHLSIHFRLFPMWRLTSSGFYAHVAPRLTWRLCRAVLTQRDLVRSAWIFQRSCTSWHRVFHMFPTLVDQATSESLKRHRLLTPAVTRVAIIITSTKNKLSS